MTWRYYQVQIFYFLAWNNLLSLSFLIKASDIRGRSQITLAHWVSYLVSQSNANLVNRPYLVVKMLTRLVSWSKNCKIVLT